MAPTRDNEPRPGRITSLPVGLPRSPRLLALVVVASVSYTLAVAPVPIIVREVFDRAIPEGDTQLLIRLGCTLVGLVVAGTAVVVWLRHLILREVQANLAEIRRSVIGSLVAMSMSGVSSRDEHDVEDVLGQDSLRYSTMVSEVYSMVIPSLLTSIAVAGVLVVMDPALAALTAALLAPIALVHRVLSRRLGLALDGYHDAFRRYGSGILRMHRRAAVTRVHGAQHLELERQYRTVGDLETTAVNLDGVRSAYQWAQQSVVVISALVVLLVGGAGVISGRRSLGELFAFYAAIGLIRPALDTVVQAVPTIAAGKKARVRLGGLAADDPGYRPPGATPINGMHLVLDRVSFGYGGTPILQDITMTVAPGTVTVVRGPNGAGKTTLIHLLCGLLQPSAGSITVDGVPLHDVDPASFRPHVGVVFQDATIAGDTIAEALAYGDHELDDAAIEHALSVTGLDRIIARLPEGIETKLSAGGIRLSGGERQRLAIAQALVRRPRLLVLDEPTNHLDAEAVAAVVANLPSDDLAIVLVTHEESRRFDPDHIIDLPLLADRALRDGAVGSVSLRQPPQPAASKELT